MENNSTLERLLRIQGNPKQITLEAAMEETRAPAPVPPAPGGDVSGDFGGHKKRRLLLEQRISKVNSGATAREPTRGKSLRRSARPGALFIGSMRNTLHSFGRRLAWMTITRRP